MYQLSIRQILLIALLSGVVAAGTVACFNKFSSSLQPNSRASDTAAQPSPGTGGISEPNTVSDEQNNIEVYRTVSPGVVYITRFAAQRDFMGDTIGEDSAEGTGSGSVIDAEGHILTNDHVVSGASKLAVNFGDGKQYTAKVIGTDPDTDLAIIQVEAPKEKLTVISFSDSDKLTVGQKVLAIGNPFGLDRTLTTGIISGLQRPIRARNGRPIEAIQTDASINPGNSGGPLLDTRGRMVGINSQILSPSGASAGIGFAVPANVAQRIVPLLIKDGKISRPKLGITTRDIAPLYRQLELKTESGVLIMGILPGGAADAAGLKGTQQTYNEDVILGDIIIAINGEKVSNTDDLYRLLDKFQVGDTIKVDVIRNDKPVSVSVRLIDAPEPRRLPRRL